MQIVLTFMTVLVVAVCLGFPVAFLGLVLEMELVQHFLRLLDGMLSGYHWYHSCQYLPYVTIKYYKVKKRQY